MRPDIDLLEPPAKISEPQHRTHHAGERAVAIGEPPAERDAVGPVGQAILERRTDGEAGAALLALEAEVVALGDGLLARFV